MSVAAAGKAIQKKYGVSAKLGLEVAANTAATMPGKPPAKAIVAETAYLMRREEDGKPVHSLGSGIRWKHQVAAIMDVDGAGGDEAAREKRANAIAAKQMRDAYGDEYVQYLATLGQKKAAASKPKAKARAPEMQYPKARKANPVLIAAGYVNPNGPKTPDRRGKPRANPVVPCKTVPRKASWIKAMKRIADQDEDGPNLTDVSVADMRALEKRGLLTWGPSSLPRAERWRLTEEGRSCLDAAAAGGGRKKNFVAPPSGGDDDDEPRRQRTAAQKALTAAFGQPTGGNADWGNSAWFVRANHQSMRETLREPGKSIWVVEQDYDDYCVILRTFDRDTDEHDFDELMCAPDAAIHSVILQAKHEADKLFGPAVVGSKRKHNPASTVPREVRLQAAMLMPQRFAGRKTLEERAINDDFALAELRQKLGFPEADEEAEHAYHDQATARLGYHEDAEMLRPMSHADRVKWATRHRQHPLAPVVAVRELKQQRAKGDDRKQAVHQNRDKLSLRKPGSAERRITIKRAQELISAAGFRQSSNKHHDKINVVERGHETASADTSQAWPNQIGMSSKYKYPVTVSEHTFDVSPEILTPTVRALNEGAPKGTLYLSATVRVRQGRGTSLVVEHKAVGQRKWA